MGKKTEIVYWTKHLFKFDYFLVNMKWIKTYFLKVVFIDTYIYRFCIQLIFLMLLYNRASIVRDTRWNLS